MSLVIHAICYRMLNETFPVNLEILAKSPKLPTVGDILLSHSKRAINIVN